MTTTIHEQLQDRMPEVARDAERWTTEEAAHLEGCAECRAEWALVSRAATLGDDVERSFDVAAAVEGVGRRLADQRRLTRFGRGPLWIGIAAAAALTFVAVRPAGVKMPASGSTGAVAPKVQLAELDSLSDDELALVADGLDAPLTDAPLLEGSPLNELDTTDLERVLRSLEG